MIEPVTNLLQWKFADSLIWILPDISSRIAKSYSEVNFPTIEWSPVEQSIAWTAEITPSKLVKTQGFYFYSL